MRPTSLAIGTCLVALILIANGMLSASTDELVKFNGAQQRLLHERGENPQELPGTAIEGYLTKPEGHGPFPAVILLHGCAGWSESSRQEKADWFTKLGYATLAVDSLGPRGLRDTCDHSMPERDADAWGALLYLSKRDFVDPRRVAVVGWSQGGIVALRIASARLLVDFDIPDDLSFKAAVAYYPFCSMAAEQLSIPTLIFVGEVDDWAPAADCQRWQRNTGEGASLQVVVYPGAFHGFDFPALGEGRRAFGHWLQFNRDAAERSMIEMRNFLAFQLGNR